MKNVIGYTAALFTTFALMPQIIRVWRLKEARDVSIYLPVMISIGSALWILYGLLIAETPIVVANAVSLIIGLITIYTTMKYR